MNITTSSDSSISSMDNTHIADSQKLPKARHLNLYSQKHKIHYCLDSPSKKGIWFSLEDLHKALEPEGIFLDEWDFFRLFYGEWTYGSLENSCLPRDKNYVPIVSYNRAREIFRRKFIQKRIRNLNPKYDPYQKLKDISDDIVCKLKDTELPDSCRSYRLGTSSSGLPIFCYQQLGTSEWWVESDFIFQTCVKNMTPSEFCTKFGILGCRSSRKKILLHFQSLISMLSSIELYSKEAYMALDQLRRRMDFLMHNHITAP